MFDIEQFFQGIRPDNAVSFPEDMLIEKPLGTGDSREKHPLNRTIESYRSNLENLSGKVIVWDLDDTLLNTNYICGVDWDRVPNSAGVIRCHPSIDYSKLRHPVSYWLKAGWKRPKREQYDSTRYPFLRNPDIQAQLRPGAISLLNALKEAGAVLVLVTLCARRRVEFLFSRIPQLKEIFTSPQGVEHIVSAEELAKCNWAIREEGIITPPEDLPEDMKEEWEKANHMHQKHADRYGLKSVLVLNRVLGLKRMDYLIDDSAEVQKQYEEMGLIHRMIHMPRKDPYALVMLDLANALGNGSVTDMTRIEASREESILLKDYPFIRFEDPLYYPLVHTSEFFQVREDN